MMNLIIFILGLMILVLVHEAGHYYVARCFNVAIAEFSIGFGKKLWSYQHPKYQTEFKIAPILIGGYVKFFEQDPPRDAGKLYQFLPWREKILILLAGPLANLVFAFWLLVLLFKLTSYNLIPRIGVLEPNGIAAQSGLKTGQKIAAVNQVPVRSWTDILALTQNKNVLYFSVIDGHQERKIRLSHPRLAQNDVFSSLGFRPLLPKLPAIIGKVQVDSLADRAGLKVGDKILAVNHDSIKSFSDLLKSLLSADKKQVLQLTIQRQHKIIITRIQTQDRWFKLGIYSYPLSHYPQWFELQKNSWFEATIHAKTAFLQLCGLQLKLWFHLPQEIQHLSSPWGISQSMSAAWSIGIKTFLQFMVWLSVSLAIVNLLPIPILDGGQCWVVILEHFFPGLIKPQGQRLLMIWSFIFLLGLFAIGVFNDFSAFIFSSSTRLPT